jgi:hypothetical protein
MTPVEALAGRRRATAWRLDACSSREPAGTRERSWEIYGRPSPAAGDAMRRAAAAGVTLRLDPEVLGGFIRLAAG